MSAELKLSSYEIDRKALDLKIGEEFEVGYWTVKRVCENTPDSCEDLYEPFRVWRHNIWHGDFEVPGEYIVSTEDNIDEPEESPPSLRVISRDSSGNLHETVI